MKIQDTTLEMNQRSYWTPSNHFKEPISIIKYPSVEITPKLRTKWIRRSPTEKAEKGQFLHFFPALSSYTKFFIQESSQNEAGKYIYLPEPRL